MKVKLIQHTAYPDKIVAIAARICYSNKAIEQIEQQLSPQKVESLISMLFKSGHLSPFEHAQFTFLIEGISRVCSHQLVRHRIASYSQRSQRYTAENSENFVVPPSITENKDALTVYKKAVEESYSCYKRLQELGIPKEDARFVLPGGWQTTIMVSMNARELHHFFSLRLCKRAQWEIQQVAKKMLKLAKEVAPILFKKAGPSCITQGECKEAHSCGRPYKDVKEMLNDA